jgi:hypothetical protein
VSKDLVKETRHHVEASRRLTEHTRRELRELAEHIAESNRTLDKSRELLKRRRDPLALPKHIGDN